MNLNPSSDQPTPAKEIVVAIHRSFLGTAKQGHGTQINLGLIARAGMMMRILYRFTGGPVSGHPGADEW